MANLTAIMSTLTFYSVNVAVNTIAHIFKYFLIAGLLLVMNLTL